jgi:hypothetical protein
MMPARKPQYADAVPLSTMETLLETAHALDAAAAADAWDDAMELETLCRALLEELVTGPQDLAQAEAIETVAIIYRRVMSLAENCRAAVAEELHQVRQGRRASNAYNAERGA